MKKVLIILILLISILFVSCQTSGKPPEVNVESKKEASDLPDTTEDYTADETDAEPFRNDKKVADILSGAGSVAFGKRLFADSIAVECGDNVYILYDNLKLLNIKTGCIQSLCNDPLCSHNVSSCPDTKNVNSIVCDGEKIYCKGTAIKDNAFSISGGEEDYSFVGYYYPETGSFTYLDTWAKELGSVSYAIAVHDGYLYYTKRQSDTCNNLCRVSMSGGKTQRVNQEDEFIVQFSVTDEQIYYRTSAFTYKCMNCDGSDTQTIGEKICMVYIDKDRIFTASSIDDGGYSLSMNGAVTGESVYSPISAVIIDNSLWYTVKNKVSFGTYIDDNGNTQSISSDNGTEIFKYDIATGEKSSYNITCGYGVSSFYGFFDSYMLLGVKNEKKLIELWLVNSEDTGEYYKIYED